jgi:hypothetical protein
MAHQDQKQSVMRYWPIVIAVLGIAVSWGVMQTTEANTRDRLSKVEVRQGSIDTTQTQILVQLGNIQTDLGWVKSALSSKKTQ